MVKTYDVSCYDLAKKFLSDCNRDDRAKAQLADLMAKDIQQAIEDFMDEHRLSD